jgi:membrane protein implicated in regulation of membrane protease activity
VKVESLLFWIGAVFYAIVTTVYYLLAHELAGAVALTLTGLMALLIAGYLQVTGQSRSGLRFLQPVQLVAAARRLLRLDDRHRFRIRPVDRRARCDGSDVFARRLRLRVLPRGPRRPRLNRFRADAPVTALAEWS